MKFVLAGLCYLNFYVLAFYCFVVFFRYSLPSYSYYLFLSILVISTMPVAFFFSDLSKIKIPENRSMHFLAAFPFGVVLLLCLFFLCKDLTPSQYIKSVRVSHVSELVANPDFEGVYFDRVKIMTQYTGEHVAIHRSQHTRENSHPVYVNYLVAPLVSDDWNPSLPVRAWVACDYTTDVDTWKVCFRQWVKKSNAGLLVSSVNNSDYKYYQLAASQSLAKNSLKKDSVQHFLFWTDSPEKYAQKKWQRFYWITIGFNMAWVVYALLIAMFEKKRVRP